MRAGILSVARKALDGCSLMNTLAAQVAADLGYATEAGQKSLAGENEPRFCLKTNEWWQKLCTNKKVQKRSKWWRESRISFKDPVKIISLEIWEDIHLSICQWFLGNPNPPDIGIISQHTPTPSPWKSTGGDDF